jgi:chromosome segregation ATPase
VTADVRKIEALETFRGSLVNYSADLNRTAEELKVLVRRIEHFYEAEQPAYWKHQRDVAERELTEARDTLSRLRWAIHTEDRPAATEAVNRVKKCEERLRLCEQRIAACRQWKINIKQKVDELLGPISDLVQHSEVLLPSAAVELGSLIDQLRRYTDS